MVYKIFQTFCGDFRSMTIIEVVGLFLVTHSDVASMARTCRADRTNLRSYFVKFLSCKIRKFKEN